MVIDSDHREYYVRGVAWILGFAIYCGLACGCPQSVTEPPNAGQAPVTSTEFQPKRQASVPVESHIRFTDVAHEAGVDWTVRNGEEAGKMSIVETLGAGVATIDYDQDGKPDLLLLGGGRYDGDGGLESLPMCLFRQQQAWIFVPVTGSANLPQPKHYHHGAFVADVDNDGFPDLLITGYRGLQLFRNQGDGTFIDVTDASGLAEDSLWSTAAAWADFNEDGELDLFVGHYVNWSIENDPDCRSVIDNVKTVCSPTSFQGLPCRTYLSNGDGTFRDSSTDLGINFDGKTLGVVVADMDGDGPVEIYVANDTELNQLYRRSPAEQRYHEIALVSGVALGDTGQADGSMGVDVGDLDGDGQLDLWVANFEDQSFAMYRNLGQHQFLHASRAMGVTSVGRIAVGFGTVIFDADGDGYPDIFCANGHIAVGTGKQTQEQLPFLFANQLGRRFRNVATIAGDYLQKPHLGRGVACADLDQNGTLDLVVTHTNSPAAILRNDTPIDNWLAVRLIGRRSCRDAIGARVKVHSGNKTQLMTVKGGGSYLSTSDPTLWFGLGGESLAEKIEIIWPSGQQQIIEHSPGRQRLIVVEPFARSLFE